MKKNKINAVIFDMDGLLLGTEQIARHAWKQAGKEWGYTIPDEHYVKILGRSVGDAQQIFQDAFGPDFPFYEIRRRRVQIIQEHIRQNCIPVKPGVWDLLDWLEARSIPKAVATSTSRRGAIERLTATNLIDRFQVIITGDQIERGKPAPDIFLAAAEALNLAAQNCVVLEDSEAGIQAAHAAGMLPIMVPDMKQPSPAIRKVAYQVIPSLHEVIEILADRIQTEVMNHANQKK